MSKMLSKMNLISVVQQLPSEDIETIQGYVEMIENENEELKKQIEQYQEEVCILDMRTDENIKLINQQKEFIKYLENKIKKLENNHEHMVIDMFGSYDLNELDLNILKEILQKYKSIIGEDK